MVSVRKSVTCFLTALVWAAPLGGQGDDWASITQEVKKLSLQGRTTEALPLAEQALRIAESTFSPLDRRLAASLNNLADLYRDRGEMAKAEGLFKRSLAIDEASMGEGHPSVAAELNNLAMLYKDEGRLQDAEPLFKRALAIYKNALGGTHPYTVIALNNIGDLYRAEGRNAPAESCYRVAAFLADKSLELQLTPETLEVAQSLRSMIRHNVGELYRSQGKYAEAEEFYKAALEIREKELGEDHPDTASTLNAMAMLYLSEGKYTDAERLCRRSLDIRRRVLGEDHRAVAYSLSTLAEILRIQQKREEAEQDYKKAIEIEEKTVGKENPLLTAPLDGLAETYQDEAKYDEAELLYRRVLAIRENEKRVDDADVSSSFLNLAVLDYARGNSTSSEAQFEEAFAHLHREFDYQFSYLGEADRLAFLDVAGSAFPLYFSFCYTYRNQNPALVGKLYDITLWQKGVVADSITGVRARAAASGNKEAQAQLEQLTALRTRIAAMQNPPAEHIQEWNQTLLQLQDEAHSLERSLVERVVQAKAPAPVTWHDVQKALRPDEAAVEFVQSRYHDGKRGTEKIYYFALVLRPEGSGLPVLVPLSDGSQMDSALEDYRALVRKAPARGAGAQFYRTFWKPLEVYLEGFRRVYVSPDGVLNVISFGVLPTDDGRLLMEKYDLNLVLSSKELLQVRNRSQNQSIALIGNPRFDLTEEQQRAALKKLESGQQSRPVADAGPGVGLRSGDSGGKSLDPLPETEEELDSIRSLVAKKGWQVHAYTGEMALATAVSRMQNPRVLHIATHGFFEPDQDRIRAKWAGNLPPALEDPMLRSGLYFAGADRSLAGAPAAEGLDDGILTAYEATGLNLRETELVVLSACDTGQGMVANGEGVFGLRRGLREAGAGSILMTLWAVPDRVTRELMTMFYEKWLSGKEKQVALREAQLEIRKKVMASWLGQDRPYYWGAFVLVGL